LTPPGVNCRYPQGLEQDGSIYVAFAGEYPDDYRNIVGAKISPSPAPDQFYLWPRGREPGRHGCSERPELVDLNGRRCVRFRNTSSAGVDLMPLDLADGDRLEVHCEINVEHAPPTGECVLLSFGDTTPDGTKPIRIGVDQSKLSVSTDAAWTEVSGLELGAWHRLFAEFTASHFVVRVDDQTPCRFAADSRKRNSRLYLGEGVIVGNLKPKPDFEFTVDLVSLRTKVTKGKDN